MLLNQEIFGIVSLTASGLLMEASVTLGMKFKPSELASLVISNDRDDREEINEAISQLLKTNLLLLQDGYYIINSDYVKNG